MRELYSTSYDAKKYTDENLLYKNKLIDTPTISRGLTKLYGDDSELFPLLSLTEGANGVASIKPKALNDTQYTWDVIGRQKNTIEIIGLVNSSQAKPGLGFTSFDVYVKDPLAIKSFGLVTADKQHKLRIQSESKFISTNKYQITVVLNTANPADYVSLGNFQTGQNWVLAAPTVAASKSDGTTSNSMAPGKWTNQFGFHRFSKPIAGNMGSKIVNIEFDTEGGGKTNLWMPFEMKMFELNRKQLLEEELWNGEYNRDANGVIHLKDPDTQEPIPTGAGIKEILKTTGQYDTYGTLTLNKFDSIVTSLFTNRVDSTPHEIVIYGGAGAFKQFNAAINADINARSLYYKLSMEEVRSGVGGYLNYGKYFSQYTTIDGYVITFKRARIFDHGTYAEMDKINGRIYDGHPYESYNMVMLDMSMNDGGERNIELVTELGREMEIGIYKGISKLPGVWGNISESKILSTKKDEASYEVFSSQGITLKNWTTSYFLEFVK